MSNETYIPGALLVIIIVHRMQLKQQTPGLLLNDTIKVVTTPGIYIWFIAIRRIAFVGRVADPGDIS